MWRKPGQGKGKTHLITGVGITTDTLTSRGGLSLFGRYVEGIGIRSTFDWLFGSMRKNGKGQPIDAIMKQVLCFFVDGTSRHLVHFDRLKEDAGYAGAIESALESLVSSHAVKRFFTAFSGVRIWLFRRLLQGLFLWRLKVTRSAVIELGIDTMVMDNDEAEVRKKSRRGGPRYRLCHNGASNCNRLRRQAGADRWQNYSQGYFSYMELFKIQCIVGKSGSPPQFVWA